MKQLLDGMIRAAKLDVSFYEKVEADKGFLGQARAVVVLSSIAAGIGSFGEDGVGGIIAETIVALFSWYIWAYLTYFIGTRFLPEPQTKADSGELLRTIGFASSPGILRIFCILPGDWGLTVSLVAEVWMLFAFVVAVRQALDYSSTIRAMVVCTIGFIIIQVMKVGVTLVTGI
jgi:hypothetical protein